MVLVVNLASDFILSLEDISQQRYILFGRRGIGGAEACAPLKAWAMARDGEMTGAVVAGVVAVATLVR